MEVSECFTDSYHNRGCDKSTVILKESPIMCCSHAWQIRVIKFQVSGHKLIACRGQQEMFPCTATIIKVLNA